MDEKSAKLVLSEIENVLKKHQVYYIVEFERKPNLKLIRIRDLVIKVDE